MNVIVPPPHNSYIEALLPNVTVFGGQPPASQGEWSQEKPNLLTP